MRVRTSHAPDGWRDMGPTPATARRSKADPFYASTIPDMAPVINFGGLTTMSGRPSDYRPTRSGREACGQMMKISKEPCALIKGHKDVHRTIAAVEAHQKIWLKRRKAA